MYHHIHACGAKNSAQDFMHAGQQLYLLSYTMALFSLSLVWKGLFELSKLVLNSFLGQEGLELEILLPLVPK